MKSSCHLEFILLPCSLSQNMGQQLEFVAETEALVGSRVSLVQTNVIIQMSTSDFTDICQYLCSSFTALSFTQYFMKFYILCVRLFPRHFIVLLLLFRVSYFLVPFMVGWCRNRGMLIFTCGSCIEQTC